MAASLKYKGDLNSLRQLRIIARQCAVLHLLSAFAFFILILFIEISNQGAVLCGIWCIGIALYPVFYCISKRNAILLFTSLVMFNLAPIWFLYLESTLPGYDAYVYISPNQRVMGLLWIALFQSAINLIYYLFWKRALRSSIKIFSFLPSIHFKPKTYVALTFFCFFFPLLIFLFYYGSAGILWSAVTSGRSETGAGSSGLLIRDATGNASSLMLPVTWIWQLTPLFGCIAFISSSRKNRLLPLLSLILGFLVIFVFFLSGSRGTLIFIAAPALFFLFYYNWNKGIRFWLFSSILFFLIIGIMELQVRFRNNLLDVISDPARAAKLQGLKSVTAFDPTQTHRDNNMYLFCLMLKDYPAKHDFEGFGDFFAVLVNPIPRAIWPDKPVLTGAKDMDQQPAFIQNGPLEMGTTSLSFSVIGEAYQARGIWGILIYSFVYAFVLLFFDGVVYYARNKQPLTIGILGICVFLAFWGFRSFFALVTFVYPLLLLLIFLRLFWKWNQHPG